MNSKYDTRSGNETLGKSSVFVDHSVLIRCRDQYHQQLTVFDHIAVSLRLLNRCSNVTEAGALPPGWICLSSSMAANLLLVTWRDVSGKPL